MAMFRSSPRDVVYRPPIKRNCDTNPETYFCNICFDGWDSETEVEIHRSVAHRREIMKLMKNSRATYCCRLCVKPHLTYEGLLKHIKVRHLLSDENATRVEREIFICNTCSALFFNKLLMQVHIITFHMGVDKDATFAACPKCYKMQRIKSMWFHFQGHHIQSVSCCKICLEKFNNRVDLNIHMKEHKKYLFCEICQYESKNELYFKEHLNTRHKLKSIDLKEDKRCWKDYFVPRSFGDYKTSVILDLPMKGVSLAYLQEHNIRICILCREICIGEQEMADHMQNHYVEKANKQYEHICTCGETFSTVILLKHHMFKNQGHCKMELDEDENTLVITFDENSS
ncbi:PREDICTED: PR domain zinc finger protein 15-like [Papilio polytes]|uniref:PR domain zinc finger protein 15-like n=1 Tax=Papilio polytes TaxID=76194 RepID=UPI000676779F|nr:PREDICTED: PR domain zinc finger protein 15-like [Papilio polytes]